MGDALREGGLKPFVLFLDENHCRNRHLIDALRLAGVAHESHSDHFEPGTPDIEWLPEIGRKEWCLLTTDKRIRRRPLEREAVRVNFIRMFYFANNDVGGAAMAVTLTTALPRMQLLARTETPPFIASINRSGKVELREKL